MVLKCNIHVLDFVLFYFIPSKEDATMKNNLNCFQAFNIQHGTSDRNAPDLGLPSLQISNVPFRHSRFRCLHFNFICKTTTQQSLSSLFLTSRSGRTSTMMVSASFSTRFWTAKRPMTCPSTCSYHSCSRPCTRHSSNSTATGRPSARWRRSAAMQPAPR